MSETPRDCEHGQQARACRICELERELAAEREKSACIEMDRDHARLDAKTERERADRLIAFLADDALAITYQSLAQYRQAAIDAARKVTT